jgi:glycopeptide antibiotics resistance protein
MFVMRMDPAKRSARERFRLAHVVWALTAVFILLLTAAPFHFDTSRNTVLAHLSRVRLDLLIAPDTGRRVSIPDFVQNLLLFVPFGTAAVWALGDDRPTRHLVSVVLLACALSVAAESIQLLTIDRISSLADVLANTGGAFMGAVATMLLRKRQSAEFIDVAKTSFFTAPTYYPTLASGLLVCVASWVPFDFTLDVGVVMGHLNALRADLWQPPFSIEQIVAFVPFLLFGFMLTQWLRELRVRFPVAIGIGAVIIAGIGLEATQIFVESRLPSVGGALANAAGGVAGALVSTLDAGVRVKLRLLTVACLSAAGIATVQWIAGHEAGISALGEIAVCLGGAYIGVWSAARTLTIRSTDH